MNHLNFSRVDFQTVPDDTTLIRWASLIQPETLERFNHRLTQTELPQQIFRNRIRSVRRLARQVGEAMRKRGETAQEQGMQAYRKLIKATQQTIEQAQQVLPALQVIPTREPKN